MEPPRLPAFLLGLGLGGFIDGIVLHQVLQWHHLLTDTGDHPMTTVKGLEANTVADGLLHLSTWLLVAAGMALTVSAWRQRRLAPPWAAQVGVLLMGWGVFNVVEGVIDHQIRAFTTCATTSAVRFHVTSASWRSAPLSSPLACSSQHPFAHVGPRRLVTERDARETNTARAIAFGHVNDRSRVVPRRLGHRGAVAA